MATAQLPVTRPRWARSPFYFNSASHLLRIGREKAVNLQEHFLDDILGIGNVPENAPGRTEHERAMLAHNPVPVRHRLDSPASRQKAPLLQFSRQQW